AAQPPRFLQCRSAWGSVTIAPSRLEGLLMVGSASRAHRALLGLAASLALPSALAQTTLTLSSWVPPAHALTTTRSEWGEMLERKVRGKVKCNGLRRGGAAPPGTFDAVRNGLADVSFAVHGYTPSRFVTPQLAEFPFLGNTSETVSVAFQRMY